MSWGAIYTQSWWGRAIEKGFGEVYEEYANPSPIAGLLSAAQDRSTYYENEAGTISLLQQLENCELVTTYGEELVINGEFDTDTSNWTPNAAATISIENKMLKVSISGSSGYPSQTISGLVVGVTYKVSADTLVGTSTKVSLYSPNLGFNDKTIDGSFDLEFTATSTSENIRLYVYGDSTYAHWNNVSLKEIIQTA